jgi:hypothetical protein
MNIPSRILPGLLACLGLAACDSDKTTGTMDDTNQSAMARVYLPDRTPAAKAQVLAWKVNDTTTDAAAWTETSADGSYSLGELPEGLYRVVARKDGLVAMQDSLRTVAGRLSPRDDTLKSQAVATGTVKMTGSDNPSTVTILVMGTDVILYNVDKSGSFKLEGLATGTYRLRLSSTNANYTTTAATIRVTAGRTTDVGTIRMNFTGTPPVDSLKARIDTAKNHVVLTWKLPEVSDFRFVRLYREPLDGSEKPVLVGYSTGTTFRDSVFDYSATSKEWLYTARIHTLGGDSGYAAWTKVTQKPVLLREASVRAYMDGYYRDSAVAPRSTHFLWISVRSSPDRPTSLSWSFQGRTVSIPVDSIDASSWGAYAFVDSFAFTLRIDSTTGDFPLVVRMKNKDGSTVYDSILVLVRSPRDTSGIDTTWRDSSGIRDSVRIDTTRWRDSLRWEDSVRRADSTRRDTSRIDTARRDTSVAPRDTMSVLHLRIVNQSADTVATGSRMNMLFAVTSAPYRARSISVRWNGSTRDTILPGARDSTLHGTFFDDTLRLSLPVGSVTGPRTLAATVIGRDGRFYTDSIRVFVVASKSKSAAMAPATEPVTVASSVASGETREAIAQAARKPDSEG